MKGNPRLHSLARYVLLTCTLVFGASCNTQLSTVPVVSVPGTTTTIILVRHAERDEGLDPPINEEGAIRAQSLVRVLGDNGVTAIFCPDLLRNRQTVAPLAEELGLDVNYISVINLADTKALANNFVDTVLAEHAGGTVLWVGNTGPVTDAQSGNLQEIYARLGGTGRAPTLYQDLYVAIIPEEGNDGVRFIKGTYGGVSSLD